MKYILEVLKQEPSCVIDYIFGDLSSKNERKFESQMQKDEMLQSFVEDVLFIVINDNLSKKALLNFFEQSEANFRERFLGC